MGSLYKIIYLFLDVAWFIMIAHIIMSWLINFQVLNLRQPMVQQVWYGLNKLLEPLYSRIRRYLPSMSGLDLAPLVALLAIIVMRIILTENRNFFFSY